LNDVLKAPNTFITLSADYTFQELSKMGSAIFVALKLTKLFKKMFVFFTFPLYTGALCMDHNPLDKMHKKHILFNFNVNYVLI